METEIVCAVIAAFSAVMVAVVNVRMGNANKRAEERAKLRQRESMLSMELMHAVSKLCIGTAMAIKNGKANGEMKDGLDAVEAANQKYMAFMQEVTAQRVS